MRSTFATPTVTSIEMPRNVEEIDPESGDDGEVEGFEKTRPIRIVAGIQVCATERVPTVRSYIWKYGALVDALIDGEWVERWSCEVSPGKCDKLYSPATSQHIKRHLLKFHAIEPDTCIAVLPGEDTVNRDVRRHFNIDKSLMKRRLVQWITTEHIPFRKVESESFRDLMSIFHPDALNALPKCADTVENWTKQIFQENRQTLANVFTALKSKLHISFDGWTSGNGLGLLAIVAYWLDEDWNPHNALLGIREVSGRHTGENMASCVLKVFEDFGLPDDRIGNFVLDNASSNDTAVECMVPEGEKDDRRLRCLAHIIHLVVTAFFSLPGETNDTDGSGKWSRYAGVRKVQKIAKFIRKSTYHRAMYKEAADEMIRLACPTRWNAILSSIESAEKTGELNQFLEDAARDAPTAADRQKITKLMLTADDVVSLKELGPLLEPFRHVTTLIEGIYQSL